MPFKYHDKLRKKDAFFLEICRLQVLKGPDRLLRIEAFIQLSKTYVFPSDTSSSQPKSSFEEIDVYLCLRALNEIVSACILKNHNLEYEIPIDDMYDRLESLFEKNNQIEKVALMLLCRKKIIDSTTRVWTRDLEFTRKMSELKFRYRDILESSMPHKGLSPEEVFEFSTKLKSMIKTP